MARPTIERPTNGAKTSGKSVTTSIVNIPRVFRLFRKFASRERSPRELALAAIARGGDADAHERLGALLADADLKPAERAFYLNKRGVALAAMGRPPEAREDFEAALVCVP